MWTRFVLVLAVLASSMPGFARTEQKNRAEILWDSYGVPHIFAKDNESAFRAFGYAQMASHGDLILRLYGKARGRAAEYWGNEYLDSDRWVWTNGIPERAAEWYKAQNPIFRRNLDAFAAGMNEYAKTHVDKLAEEVRAVLPVSATDVLANGERVILFEFVTSQRDVQAEVRQSVGQMPTGGSNAWAISPKRTAGHHAMLLANPHLPWGDLYTFYEAHLNTPTVNIYGTTLVGSPVISIGFNDHLGWSHTVNTIDAADVYELTPSGDGYRYDGAVRPFEVTHHAIKVKKDAGMQTVDLTIRRSIQGPVVQERGGKMYALRVAGLDAPGAAEEWWDMDRARNVKEFEAALRRLQIPMFNVVYADRDGHILYVFNGTVPVRPKGDWNYWTGVVPGDTSQTLWTKVHPYSDLPRVLDPPTGWLQNTNDPPWTSTYPAALDAAKFPAYMSPQRMEFRPQRSTRMIRQETAFTLDKLVQAKHSTHSELADRMLDDLIAAARKSDNSRARQGADFLDKWDRSFDADSRGAVLFDEFVQRWLAPGTPSPFAVPWSAADPLNTPKGLANPGRAVSILAEATAEVEKREQVIDIRWGDVNRFKIAGVNLPGNGESGQLGVFRVINFWPVRGEHPVAAAGDSFVAAVEFSNPVQARVLIGYGNSSQPGSPHRTDQMSFLVKKELRTAWLTRREVEQHLETREVVE
ncbi:MAG TPA: acylase [Bryobacteraceae bacterium]|nr:acylase [Bryobacteraceae bacterium]